MTRRTYNIDWVETFVKKRFTKEAAGSFSRTAKFPVSVLFASERLLDDATNCFRCYIDRKP